jgi:integrase
LLRKGNVGDIATKWAIRLYQGYTVAGLSKDKRTGNYLVPFRFDGEKYLVSAKTGNQKEAQQFKARIEETLRLIERGSLALPADADAKTFIVSGGKLLEKVTANADRLTKLGQVCDGYLADQQGKAKNTLKTERIHVKHLVETLGKSTKLNSLSIKSMQDYVNQRARAKYREKPISGRTVRKELATFALIWSWAKARRYVANPCPLYDESGKMAVEVAKSAEREKFQTWAQIERRIKRGGVDDKQKAELWASLFLDNDQVIELLKHVKENARHPFIYPMYVFAAYTGARRSEIVRSQIDDFDFEHGTIRIRETKRRKSKSASFRFVDLHPTLAGVMKEWFGVHPGGPFTSAAKDEAGEFVEVNPDEATHHFKQPLLRSKWKVVRGFHVLRHSFGSNLARAGVARDRIADWMGHTTEEMKDLYQHLFPQDGASQIAALK